jgi:hypothetical protein
MEERITPEAMKLRSSTVEHPFATIKYRIFGHPRLLVRGLSSARREIAIATMAYNLKRITNVLGASKLTEQLPKLLMDSSLSSSSQISSEIPSFPAAKSRIEFRNGLIRVRKG